MVYNHPVVKKSCTSLLPATLSLIVIFSLAICLFINISVVQAQATYTLLEPLPCITGEEPGCAGGVIKEIGLGDFFQYAFNLLIAISSAAAVFMIVWGGFRYVTTDSWQEKNDGLKIFKNAIFGLLMVLGAFLIMKTVNPKLVAIPASIPPVNVPESQLRSLSSLFDRLNTEAQEYRSSIQNIREDIEQLDSQTKIESEKTIDIEDKIRDTIGDLSADIDTVCNNVQADETELYDLCVQRAQSLSRQRELIGNANLQAAKGIIESSVYKCNPTEDPRICEENLQQITKVYIDYADRLQPEQLKQLSDAGLYSQAIIKMNLASATLYKNIEVPTIGLLSIGVYASNYVPDEYKKTIASINEAANAYASKPGADPALIQKVKEQQENILQIVRGMKVHASE